MNVMSHDYNFMRNDSTVKHHVYSDKPNDHNVMLHDNNVMRHHYNVKWHAPSHYYHAA
jgi:hypothetical protein